MQQDEAVLGILVQMSATFFNVFWKNLGQARLESLQWCRLGPDLPLMLLATHHKHPLHLGTPAGCQTTFPMLKQQRASLLSPKEASPSALPQFSSYLAGGRRCAGDPARVARPLTSGKWF